MAILRNLFLACLPLFPLGAISTNITAPVAPALEYMYTAYADCKAGLYESQTPKGIRTAIPIVGGNFTGPRLNGKILNLGADWGLTDPRTGIFSADTRYQLKTNDGANIFIQTAGSEQPSGTSHLRVQFETGDKEYYWLNSVIAVGLLDVVTNNPDGSYVVKIDVFNLANEWKETKWKNVTAA